MPRRQLLSPAQRAEFLAFPDLTGKELAWHYTLNENDLEKVARRRRVENRLGYALQLLIVRHLGRTLEAGERPPESVVAFVAEQLGTQPELLARYALRDETRREHAAEILRDEGLSRFDRRVARVMSEAVLDVALRTPRGLPR